LLRSWIGIVLILFVHVRSDVPVAATNEILKGTYERIDDEKIEMVYQLPSSGVVKGVLAVFHGCSHRATDWFPKSESCKKCIGLPVERVIAKKALDSGLAVLALSSSNKEHKCWSPHSDTMPVARAIKHFYTVLSTKQSPPSVVNTAGAGSSVYVIEKMSPPLFLLGASSGGSFVGNFAAEGKSLNVLVSALCVQISVVRQTNQSSRLPPTLFVHMTLDPHTSRGVNRAVEVLNKKTTTSTQDNNIRAAQMTCEPKALGPTYFFDHGAALSAQDSTTLVTAFKEAGIVDSTTGKLKNDPRSSMVDWRQVGRTENHDNNNTYDC